MRYQLRHAPVVPYQSIPAVRTSPNPHGHFFRKTHHSIAKPPQGEADALRSRDDLAGHIRLTLGHRVQRPRLFLQVAANGFLQLLFYLLVLR